MGRGVSEDARGSVTRPGASNALGSWREILDRLLASSKIYAGPRRLIGAESEMRNLMERVVTPDDTMRILDFGCGNGRLVPFVGNAQYLGIDNTDSNIDAATIKYGQSRVPFLSMTRQRSER